MLHLSQRNRQPRALAEFALGLRGFIEHSLRDFLALRDAQLLVESSNVVNRGFDPGVRHGTRLHEK